MMARAAEITTDISRNKKYHCRGNGNTGAQLARYICAAVNARAAVIRAAVIRAAIDACSLSSFSGKTAEGVTVYVCAHMYAEV
jgi:hypothetical protein